MKTLILLCISLFSLSLFAEDVSATIDGKCILKTATITVPAGKTAKSFTVKKLVKGVKCVVGGAADSKGWGIKNSSGAVVYSWSQFKSNKASEVGGPLSSLTLAAGTYTVYVDGRYGAIATVSFSK